MIADWVEWYYRRSDSTDEVRAFQYLENVISILSHPFEPLQCGEPRKVFLEDSRKFPTLKMPYGTVPHPQWSAGVKRVVNFAYLLVWAWVEHLQAASLRKEEPTERIVLIVDEMEAHLHPKWQRTILPAILSVVESLRANIDVQIFASTHSPLVLASAEPCFDETNDKGRDQSRVAETFARHGFVLATMDSAGDAMIPFQLAAEPPAFDEKCRQPGMKWLAENPGYDRLKDFWSDFERDLYRAFN